METSTLVSGTSLPPLEFSLTHKVSPDRPAGGFRNTPGLEETYTGPRRSLIHRGVGGAPTRGMGPSLIRHFDQDPTLLPTGPNPTLPLRPVRRTRTGVWKSEKGLGNR